MDVQEYEKILQGLKDYNAKLTGTNFGNAIVSCSPQKPTYPLTVFEEVGNTPITGYTGIRERVASLSYEVNIYAKTKGAYSKQKIARHVAAQIDRYLSFTVGLKRVSFNRFDEDRDDGLYRIVMIYTANYFENKQRIL